MNVLYIVTAFDRESGDGITPWLNETIHRLGERGTHVEVLAPAYRGGGATEVDGIRVHRFRYAPRPLETLTHDQTAPDRIRERPAYGALVPGYLASAARHARRLVRTGRYDVIHAHWPIPHAVPGLAARRLGTPLVLTFHGAGLTFVRTLPIPCVRRFLRHAVRTADAVTANSTYTAGLIRGVEDRAVDIVPFGTTVSPPSEVAEPGPETAPTRILFVGRLVERKGLHHLLDAVAQLKADVDIECVIAGDGPQRDELARRIRGEGLDDQVELAGFVSAERLAREYRTADVFVLPAATDAKGDVEGLGVVLIEALAHRRPVVASEAGGIVDIVRHEETGLLVPPADGRALARAIQRLVEDPDLARRLGHQGRRHVENHFGWDAITGRLEAIYHRVRARK